MNKRLWFIALLCSCDAWLCLLFLWQIPFIYSSVHPDIVRILAIFLLTSSSISIVSLLLLFFKLPQESWRGIGEMNSSRCFLVLSLNFIAMTFCIIFYTVFVV
ncbi:MAG: hypothetical protein HRU15_06445 [Planctomycetes bacterium]|nr:hypothetical protein [Planctomycetota bacterium]